MNVDASIAWPRTTPSDNRPPFPTPLSIVNSIAPSNVPSLNDVKSMTVGSRNVKLLAGDLKNELTPRLGLNATV